jgi:hypothetical protein
MAAAFRIRTNAPAGGAARVALASSETEHRARKSLAARSLGVKVSAANALAEVDLREKDEGVALVDGSGAVSARTQAVTPPSDTISCANDDCTRTKRSNNSAARD